jgi:3-deoxy-D-manno-octulosonic-acid transferase
MRWLYTLLWILILPMAFMYLAWRAVRQPEYLRHWRERLGGVRVADDGRPLIWLHAVSVGETRASEPLVRALRREYPGARILLTHGTPTGRATGRELFGDTVTQAYLPYDLPWLARRFLRRARPSLGIVMETEIWPNLFQGCRDADLPLYLVNCRLSERSARGYRRLLPLVKPTLAAPRGIAAQNESDARRLIEIGARDVTVVGNLKFDVAVPTEAAGKADALRARIGARFCCLAASTRDGEEALLIEAWRQLGLDDALLLVVPRHPQRFEEVARLLRDADPNLARRGGDGPVDGATKIMLGDSMGEMAMYYAACDVAFIGGSLLPFGGQNLIEAAVAGKPILIGPHTWNFEDIAEQALAAGAAWRVGTPGELADALRRLHDEPDARVRMGAAGAAFAARHRGATQRTLEVLAPGLARLTSAR